MGIINQRGTQLWTSGKTRYSAQQVELHNRLATFILCMVGTLFYGAFPVSRQYSVDKWMMMNSEGFCRKWWWPYFKVIPRHSPGGIEENHEEPQTALPNTTQKFRPLDNDVLIVLVLQQ
jgi:hypothetical protein